MAHFGQSDDFRRDELIRIIEHSVENLTLAELEALYYDMTDKFFRMLSLVYIAPPSIWVIQRPFCPFVTFLDIDGF